MLWLSVINTTLDVLHGVDNRVISDVYKYNINTVLLLVVAVNLPVLARLYGTIDKCISIQQK